MQMQSCEQYCNYREDEEPISSLHSPHESSPAPFTDHHLLGKHINHHHQHQSSRSPSSTMLSSILPLVTVLAVHVSGQDDQTLAGLAVNIPGLPGQDYPIFAFPPETSFLCDSQIQGYYGDPEADCKCGDYSSVCLQFFLQARPSIFVQMMEMMDCSSIVSSVLMEHSSISNTLSVTGGSMLTAH
jgi:hypothetical protein